jgi:hypothetical protein
MVAAFVSGGRHEDFLASRHGDTWWMTIALHPHMRELVR